MLPPSLTLSPAQEAGTEVGAGSHFSQGCYIKVMSWGQTEQGAQPLGPGSSARAKSIWDFKKCPHRQPRLRVEQLGSYTEHLSAKGGACLKVAAEDQYPL